MSRLKDRIESLTTKKIQEILDVLWDNDDDFDAKLDIESVCLCVLEKRMDEKEFIEYCHSIMEYDVHQIGENTCNRI